MQKVGTVSRGLIAPIIRQGDDIAKIAVDTLLAAAEAENFIIRDRDILAITESVVARAQGNYASTDHIACDVQKKFGNEHIGLLFPILSRNRFSICLEGIAKAGNQLTVALSYPSDEVGNPLVSEQVCAAQQVNTWADSFTAEAFHEKFGLSKHPFTGIDYIAHYAAIIQKYNKNSSVILTNNPAFLLEQTKHVIACDIHSRFCTKQILREKGAQTVYGLDDILRESVRGSGYNSQYGLLGSNKATEDSIKLFPNNCQPLVEAIQARIKEKTGQMVEVLVYGDGAFKDPAGKIWELADPVVSPGFTAGLNGTPHEIKLKYAADTLFKHLPPDEQQKAMIAYISKHKTESAADSEEGIAQGTTPRRLTDLIGSLCDLTSGSGDKGTPFIFIQGYFNKYGE